MRHVLTAEAPAMTRLTGGAGNDYFSTEGSGRMSRSIRELRASYLVTTTWQAAPFRSSMSAPGAPDGTDTVSNVEKFQFADGPFVFTAGAETITGNSAGDTVVGTAGAETITGNSVRGLSFNSTDSFALFTAAGDTLEGAAGAETITGNSVSGLSINSTGSFALFTAGTAVAEPITANSAGDTLEGTAGAETITGNSVSGLSINSTGSFALFTAAGDTLEGAAGAETITGNSVSGLSINSTGSFALITAGTAGAETITGNSAGDTLEGTAGAETITGNSVSGLSINSTGSFALFTAAGDTLEGAAGAETITGSAGSVTLFGATNGETLSGGANTHTITGGAGNDTLTAGAGNDTLTGGAGNDYLDGGIGTDVAVYSGPRASYLATTLAGGAIQIVDERAGSPDGTDTVSNVEKFQFADGLFVFSVPQVTDTTTAGEKVAHGTTVAVGTVTPGLPGDTLTLTELTGPAGAVTLANGVVSFAAPANASGNVAFSYQISDQLGAISRVVSDTLAVDPGPSVTDTTTAGEKVAHGTTLAVGTVTPGLSGDTLTLTELTGPAGAVTLNNGVVSFAAPANASGNVAFSYQISDQLGAISRVVSDTLAVDPGPTAGNAHVFITAGQSVDLTSLLLFQDTPGLPGDTLSLSAIGRVGTLGTVTLNNGDLIYTGPTTGGAIGGGSITSDAFTYTVSDQLHESATASVNVSLLNNGSTALTGSGNIVITTDGNRTVTGGSGGNFVSLGGGNDSVSLGGDNNTVVLGDGNDSVSLSGKNNMVRLGNGNDSVTAGDGSTITLGDGNDLVYAGANSTIVVGNGNNTVFAGANDTITLGKGHDLVAFGVNPSRPAIGHEVVSGFGKGDTLEFNHQLLSDFKTAMLDAKQMGADTVITIDQNDSVTLKGVAITSLTANNFKFP